MQIAEFTHQAVPDLALVASAPQRHRDRKEDKRQGGAQPHLPHFAAPLLTVLHTSLDHLSGIHVTEHGHAHLVTDLVIDRHPTSSVHRKLLVLLLAGSMPDGSCLVFCSLLLA